MACLSNAGKVTDNVLILSRSALASAISESSSAKLHFSSASLKRVGSRKNLASWISRTPPCHWPNTALARTRRAARSVSRAWRSVALRLVLRRILRTVRRYGAPWASRRANSSCLGCLVSSGTLMENQNSFTIFTVSDVAEGDGDLGGSCLGLVHATRVLSDCADLPRVEQSRAELQLPVLSNCRRGPRALRHDADSIVEFQLKVDLSVLVAALPSRQPLPFFLGLAALFPCALWSETAQPSDLSLKGGSTLTEPLWSGILCF
mmetsp:Transcript_36853/g.84954  ORF Transcript_36853/g.84954 Transcript_36853/m.84954 type:complete len:263 (+) Transcript_36853:4196-4984(+)